MIPTKRGAVILFTIMLGITIIVLALALAGPVRSFTTTTMNATNLDCGNSSISTFDKGACIVTDLNPFYFVGGLIVFAGALLTAKLLLK